jgi:acyltransferase
MHSGRISWIDIAKGLGIILVIHGHTLSPDSYRYIIYAFHMPLFFFLSGLVFRYDKYSLLQTIQKTIKNLLIPYFLFALLSYGLWIVNNGAVLTLEKVIIHLHGIIYGNSSSLFFNNILWFLPCLIITKIAFAVFAKTLKKDSFILFSLIASSVMGYHLSIAYPKLTLPFGIESAFTAIVFFGSGSLITTQMKKYHLESIRFYFKKYQAFFLLLFVMCLFILSALNFNSYGRQIDLRLNNLSNYFFFYIAAASGIMATIIISMKLKKNYILEYIGKNTLLLFALHPLVFDYIYRLLGFPLFQYLLSNTHTTFMPYIYTMFSIGIILGIGMFSRMTIMAFASKVQDNHQ